MELKIFSGTLAQVQDDSWMTPYKAGQLLRAKFQVELNQQNIYGAVATNKLPWRYIGQKKCITWATALDWYTKRSSDKTKPVLSISAAQLAEDIETLKEALALLKGEEYVREEVAEEEVVEEAEIIGGEPEEDEAPDNDDEA